MPKFKIQPSSESKLSKTVAKIAQDSTIEKTGFITDYNDRTIYYKTKSFRLRQLDSMNLAAIVKEINKNSDRKIYSDSEVIRGIINYISEHSDANIKKLMPYIKNSS
jgi:hypothetical protein